MHYNRREPLFGIGLEPLQGKRVTNWRSLVGHTVQIWHGNHVVDQGVVDAVTADGDVLWLVQRGAVERRMVVKERGVGLWIQLVG